MSETEEETDMFANSKTKIFGIEFVSEEALEDFLGLYPGLRRKGSMLGRKDCLVLLLKAAKAPTWGIKELFCADGSLYATVLGPDALEEIYTVYEFDYYIPGTTELVF